MILRAGQSTWRDPAWSHSWKESKRAGLLRGSYFFYDSRADPKRQAELWAAVLDGDLGEMELWADFEEKYGGKYTGWQYWYDFMENVKLLIPSAKMGVYTGYYYWREFVNTANALNYFKQYPLWIAAYNPVSPSIPAPYKDYLYWQFTDSGDGYSYGVQSREIDLNRFNGTEAEFFSRYGLTEKVSRMTANFGNTQVEYKENPRNI